MDMPARAPAHGRARHDFSNVEVPSPEAHSVLGVTTMHSAYGIPRGAEGFLGYGREWSNLAKQKT